MSSKAGGEKEEREEIVSRALARMAARKPSRKTKLVEGFPAVVASSIVLQCQWLMWIAHPTLQIFNACVCFK